MQEDIVVDQYGCDFIEDDDDEEDNEISEDLLGFGMDNLFENRRSRRQKVHMKRDSQLMSSESNNLAREDSKQADFMKLEQLKQIIGKIVSCEDDEIIDMFKSVKNQVLPQEGNQEANDSNEESKISNSQTRTMFKYNSERKGSDNSETKNNMEWASTLQNDSNQQNPNPDEREKDLFNKLDTKMIEDDDDFEVMENVEKNEHFECDDIDDDELDQQLIDKQAKANKEKGQKQVSKEDDEDDDDNSDWSSSDQSETDKKKIKPVIIKKNEDIVDGKKQDFHKVTMTIEPSPKIETKNKEISSQLQPQKELKVTKEVPVENLNELLFKLCKAKVVNTTDEKIYVQSENSEQVYVISKINLQKDICKTLDSEIEQFQPVRNTFRGENSRFTEMDKQFLRNILQDSKPQQNIEPAKVAKTEENSTQKSDQLQMQNDAAKPSKAFNFSNLEDMGDMMDDDLDEPDEPDSDWGSSQQSEDEKEETKIDVNKPEIKEALKSEPNLKINEMNRRNTIMIFDELNEADANLTNINLMIENQLIKSKSSVAQNTEMLKIAKNKLKLLSQEETHDMLLNLIQERSTFVEKLKIAQSAIINRDEKIEKIQSHSNILPLNMTEAKVHLAFLFSSPLIRKTNSKMENIMQLDYLSEISDIIKVCEHIDHEMKYLTNVATVSNLRSTITDCPIALHFSGHGIENTPESLGSDYFLNKEKGNILLLEDEQGMSDYFFEKDLKYMIEMSKNTFEVVFVSSCYSQFAGEVFLNAGAKHVICIRSGERISDKASLRFSRVFYETLFVKNYNVCTAFNIAKEEINKVINATEANKFVLLVQPEKRVKGKHSNVHQCKAISNFKEGTLKCLDRKPIFDSIPSKVEGFVGRQQEMYEIINLLEQNRLVSILGPPGIGKTSISRNLANYVRDRRMFGDGIIYVELRGCETAHMFLTRLSILIRSNCSIEEYKKYGLDKLDSDNNEQEEGVKASLEEDMKYRGFIISMLKQKEVLLVLDNTEDPLEFDNLRFVSELNAIIDNCRNVKFLVTTRKTINKLAHNAERPYTLQPLAKEASLKLLISKAPRNIKNQELHELLKCEIPKGCKVAQSLNIKNKSQGGMTLLDHPFTALLGGHPQAISLAAPLLEYKSLKELFYAFCDSNVMDALEVSGSKNASTSLRVSLELSINNMKNAIPEALNLFGFIGLLPGGVTDDELTKMWGNTKWMALKDALIRASLLVYKTDNKGTFVYSMLPFMSVRAFELLEQNDEQRHSYHIKCCKLFKDYCYSFYISDKSIDKVEALIGMETNIWACIYRSCNKKRDIAYVKAQQNCSSNDDSDEVDEIQTNKTEISKLQSEIDSISDSKDSILSIIREEQVSHRGVGVDDKRSSIIDLIRAKPITNNSMLIEVDPKEKQIESINLSTKFIDEEMLVLYYALDLIMCDVQKVTDALKAITEYLQKQEISTLGKANIYKTLGCLLMLSELDSDVSYSMETLNLALTYFSALKQKRGVAFTKFSILKLYCLKWKILSSQNGGSNSSSDLYSEFQNSLVGKTAKNLGKECLLLFIELNDTVYQTKTTKLVNYIDKLIQGKEVEKISELDVELEIVWDPLGQINIDEVK